MAVFAVVPCASPTSQPLVTGHSVIRKEERFREPLPTLPLDLDGWVRIRLLTSRVPRSSLCWRAETVSHLFEPSLSLGLVSLELWKSLCSINNWPVQSDSKVRGGAEKEKYGMLEDLENINVSCQNLKRSDGTY